MTYITTDNELRQIDLNNEPELEDIFKISDISNNPHCKRFRSFYKTLKAWNSPLEIWIIDFKGFVAFTNGKRVNNMYELCIHEQYKKIGLGTILFNHFLARSKGKKIRFRTDERYDGLHFFNKKNFKPIKKEGNEFIYEQSLEE